MVTMDKIPTMVTIRKAAELTGLSYNCLRKLCISQQIVHIKAGSKFLINLEKLTEYLNQGEVNQSPERIAE